MDSPNLVYFVLWDFLRKKNDGQREKNWVIDPCHTVVMLASISWPCEIGQHERVIPFNCMCETGCEPLRYWQYT